MSTERADLLLAAARRARHPREIGKLTPGLLREARRAGSHEVLDRIEEAIRILRGLLMAYESERVVEFKTGPARHNKIRPG